MRSTLAALLVLALVLPGLAETEREHAKPITIGDSVPHFELKDLAGGTFSLEKARQITEQDALAAVLAAAKSRAGGAALAAETELASLSGLGDDAARKAFLQEVGRPYGLIVTEEICGDFDTIGDVVSWITDCAKAPIVFMCWSPMCSTSRGYEHRIQAIIAGRGARFYPLASASAKKERDEDVVGYLAEHKLPYHVLLDRSQVACDIFGGRVTPHIFVVDAQNCLRYAGSIDNDPAIETEEAEERQNWLDDALGALLDEMPVYVQLTDPKG